MTRVAYMAVTFGHEPPALGPSHIALRTRLTGHVQHLASVIGERHVSRSASLERAATYIEEQLASAGYEPASQSFDVQGRAVRNVEAIGRGSRSPDRTLVIGAHYDTVPGCPGANDNGTGCAALLELARSLASRNPATTVRFVAFVNEEPPFFQTAGMGSLRYAQRCRAAGLDVVGMISLETIGYYTDRPDSQQYPVPLHPWYPRTGHFVGFVSNLQSARFLARAVRAYRRGAAVPAESAALPSIVPGVGWSDHWAFWQQRYAGIMVTDTAPYRYPHYHTAADTAEKIEYDRFTLVVDGLLGMLVRLAGESDR
jgi:Zn-dependent M28 family amino/carboxypeptidase